MATSRLDRLVDLSRAVLNRLERGDRLGDMLPQARLVADLWGDKKHVHWLDFEIYGLTHVPFLPLPLTTPEQKQGCLIFMELHSVQDVRDLTVDAVIERWKSKEEYDPKRDSIMPHSVAEIERSVEQFRQPDEYFMATRPDEALQLQAYQDQQLDVVRRVRDYLHRFVGEIWERAVEEKENIALLGPDYRIVTDNLDALATGVGQELLSALQLLRSNNPADWSAAALVCRNVILKLGRTLFLERADEYESALAGRPLNLKGERELNRLCAFIDQHWREADDSAKRELERLEALARHIYSTASRGKRGTELRHAEAQQLVIDTFELVVSLGRLVGLEPLSR